MGMFGEFEPSVRFREALALSPDGTRLAYIDDSQGQFNLSVRPLAGGAPRRLTSYTESSVWRIAWYPDGRSLLFIADSAGDEQQQLYRVDEAGGTPAALTDAPGARYWPAEDEPFSPDGKHLAYAGNDRTPADQDVLIRDVASGEVRRVYARGGRVYAGRWSPDGTRLVITERRGAMIDWVIYLLSVDDGEITRLTKPDDPATYVPGPWLPDGSGIVVLTDRGRDVKGLGVLDAATAELSWIDTPDWEVEEVALARDGRVLAWLVNVDGAAHLRARDLSTGTDLTTPALPVGAASNLLLTPDGRAAVMLLSTPTKPWNILTVDLTTGELRWLTDEAPRVDPAVFVEPATVRYPRRDGQRTPAELYRPDTSGQVPVVLVIHGGPPMQQRPDYGHEGLFQYLASRGVAVLAPNIRGSSGYGLAYQRAVHRDWGGVDLADLEDAVRYLRDQPWVDPRRIGLFGRSYGGFCVLSCVTRLPQYDWAAAVSWCGPSNLVTFSRAQPPTWRSLVTLMIGDPDTDADFLTSRSPITYADQIRAPLFLIQGANDIRVSKHENDQIAQRLAEQGIDVRYDIYPNEGHIFGNRANQMKVYADAAEFLLAHLLPRFGSAGSRSC